MPARRLHKYQVASDQRDQPGLRIQPLSNVKLAKGSTSFADTLPALSLTIYSSYDLDHSARGVTAE